MWLWLDWPCSHPHPPGVNTWLMFSQLEYSTPSGHSVQGGEPKARQPNETQPQNFLPKQLRMRFLSSSVTELCEYKLKVAWTWKWSQHRGKQNGKLERDILLVTQFDHLSRVVPEGQLTPELFSSMSQWIPPFAKVCFNWVFHLQWEMSKLTQSP